MEQFQNDFLSKLNPASTRCGNRAETFLSAPKRKFFEKITTSLQNQMQIVFWADIELGGFQMFERLQAIFSSLCPMRMSGEDVISHHLTGLKRTEHSLREVPAVPDSGKYPLFYPAVENIGVWCYN